MSNQQGVFQNSGTTSNSLSFAYFGDHEAETIFFILHGWNTTGGAGWFEFAQTLSEHNNAGVYVLDLPGFGDSPELQNSKPSIPQYSQAVAHAITELHARHPQSQSHMVGHSFGGQISAYMVGKKDYIPTSLILAAPAIVRPQPSFKVRVLSATASLAKKLIGSNETLESVWSVVTGSKDYAQKSETMKAVMRRIIRYDVQHVLSDIHIPVLILWGSDDSYTPVHQLDLITDTISDVTKYVFPGINHGLHIHAQQKCIDAIIKFTIHSA